MVETIIEKGAMTLLEYGAIGFLLLVTTGTLVFIIKKLVLDQDIQTRELSSLIKTLITRIEARDDILLNTVEDVYKQRDKCQEELATKLSDHHDETAGAIEKIHSIVVQLRDGVGCSLPGHNRHPHG